MNTLKKLSSDDKIRIKNTSLGEAHLDSVLAKFAEGEGSTLAFTALTKEMVEAIANKTVPLYHITNSLAMSLERSDDEVVEYYDYLTKELVALQKQENKELRNNEKLTVSDFKNKQYSFSILP